MAGQHTFLQIWVASGVLVNMFVLGIVTGFPTVLLPALMSKESPIPVDLETGSWIASIIGLAYIPGYLVSAVMMDVCGRRLSHILLVIPGIVGWILAYFSKNVTTLLVARGLGGFAVGGTVTLGAMVIAEYTSPQLRGFFLNFKTSVHHLGKLVVHALGSYLHWKTVVIIAMVLQTAALLMTLTWPMSPAWLISKNRFKKSGDSFFKLRGCTEDTEKEFAAMVRAQRIRQSKVEDKSLVDCVKEFFKKFFRKDFLMPFAICAVANAVSECSGTHYFPAYAIQIIEKVTREKTATIYIVLAIDCVATLGAGAAAVLSSRVRRRTLLLSTSFGAVVVLAVFCVRQLLVSHQAITTNTYTPITLIFIYFILINLGAAPIPFVLMGEIFPLPYRSMGPGLLGIVIAFYVTMFLKVTPLMLETIDVHGMFTVFGSIMTSLLVLMFFILPETKDRTLQDIEDEFNGDQYTDKEDTKLMTLLKTKENKF